MPGRKQTVQATSSTAADQVKSRLLGLPAELRNHIYELTFADWHCIIPLPASSFAATGRTFAPKLLLACKQIHAEAVQIFYSETIFCCDSPIKLNGWLHKIGLANRKALRRVALRPDAHSLSTLHQDERRNFIAVARKWVATRKEVAENVLIVTDYRFNPQFSVDISTVLSSGEVRVSTHPTCKSFWDGKKL